MRTVRVQNVPLRLALCWGLIFVCNITRTAAAANPCPAGESYRNLTQQCEACPDKYFKAQAGSHSCSPCASDRALWYAVTSALPRTSASACTCVEGFTTAYDGTTATIISCTPQACGPGMFRQEIGAVCTLCPAGSIKPGSGDSGCVPCPAPLVANAARTGCQAAAGFSACATNYDGIGALQATKVLLKSIPASSGTSLQTSFDDATRYAWTYRLVFEYCPAPISGDGSVSLIFLQNGCQYYSSGSNFFFASSSGVLRRPVQYSTCAMPVISTGTGHCPSGYRVDIYGSYYDFYCYPCPAGTSTQDAIQADTCLPCAPGSYQNATGQSACVSCPRGSYQPASGATACVACDAATTFGVLPGAVSTAYGCQDCAEVLGEGAVQFPGMAPDAYNCTCPAGTTWLDYSCRACNPGFFKPDTGMHACKPCPAGTYQPGAGAASCRSCHTRLDISLSDILSYTFNVLHPSSRPAATSDSDCQCAATQIQAETWNYELTTWVYTCSFCKIGEYVAPGTQTCTSCPVGTYRQFENTANCSACPPGTTTAAAGADAHTDCVCANTTSACCDRGSFFNASTNSCQACPIQTFKNTLGKDAACTPCDKYSVADSAKHTCRCADNTYHVGHCMPYGPQYPWGILLDTQSTQYSWHQNPVTVFVNISRYDQDVETNYRAFLHDLIVTKRADITCRDQQGGGRHLIVVAVGRTQYEGDGVTAVQQFAITCHQIAYEICTPDDFYTLASNRTFSVVLEPARACEAEQCLAPLVPDAHGNCVCDRGYGRDLVHEECRACPPLTISVAQDLSVCVPCPEHTEFAVGGVRCACAAGRAMQSLLAANDTCGACAPGTHAPVPGLLACLACVPGSIAPLEGAVACEACAVATFATENATRCKECEAGTFGNRTGLSVCEACSVGTFSLGNASVCDLCAVGSFAGVERSTSCEECAAGTFAQTAGQSVCGNCSAGSFSRGNASICTLCAVGTFSGQEQSTTCQGCAAGTFGNLSGLSACENCSAGSFSRGNASTCALCAVGFFSGQEQSTTCQGCAAGTFGNQSGLSVCESCRAGSFSRGNASICALCTVGTFSGEEQSTTCQECPAGTFASQSGQSACAICSAGTFSLANASTCSACPTGSFSERNASQCSLCAAGSFAGAEQSTRCELCTAGTFASEPGQSACEACAAGTSAPQNASTACVDCAPGTFTSQPGRAECTLCEAGTFASENASTVCQDCAAGFFASLTGATVCEACAPERLRRSQGVQSVHCVKMEHLLVKMPAQCAKIAQRDFLLP